MKSALLIGKILITVLLLGYLFSQIDLRDLKAPLHSASRSLLLLAVLQLALQPVLGSWRWYLILQRVKSNLVFGQTLRLTYIGTFLNQVLPSTVGGDAVRMWLASRLGCRLRHAVNSVAVDRLAMLMALVILVVTATPWLSRHLEIAHLQLGALLLLTGSVAGMVVLMFGDQFPVAMQRWRAVRAIGYLAEDTRAIFLDFKLASSLLLLSCVSYINMTITMYLFLMAIGVQVSFIEFALLIPPVLLVSSAPISIGGWGTREIATVALLGTLGISPGNALLVSVLFGLASILVSSPGALFYLNGVRAHEIPGVDAVEKALATDVKHS